MSKSEALLEKEAEELQKKSKVEAGEKNFDVAILLLTDARDIYLELGFQGQIGMIDNQIARYKRMMELEKKPQIVSKDTGEKRRQEIEANHLLERAKNLAAQNLYDNAMKHYQEALDLFEKIDFQYQCKQIRWQINQLIDKKKIADMKKEAMAGNAGHLSIAEERRLRVLMEQEEKQKKLDVERENNLIEREKEQLVIEERRKAVQMKTAGMKLKEELERKRAQVQTIQHHDWKKQELREKEERMRMLQEAKKKEEEKLQQAEKSLATGKSLVDKKEFQEAKQYYNEAIDLFTELKWDQQVVILKKELRNIDVYAQQHKEKLKESFLKKKKQEKEFEKRIASELEKKRKIEEERLARLRALPPELQEKLNRATMALERAEKEIELKKYPRVLGRYEYVLEIYKSFETDKINLSSDITEVEQKIADLKAKM